MPAQPLRTSLQNNSWPSFASTTPFLRNILALALVQALALALLTLAFALLRLAFAFLSIVPYRHGRTGLGPLPPPALDATPLVIAAAEELPFHVRLLLAEPAFAGD